jgi:negative regulator of sigma E activity
MSKKMTHDHDIDFDFEPAPPDKLYAHNRRQLSAMLDGELSPDQARFMLRRLQHDAELAACWERWQVCGDVLRGRGHALLPADFSRRVAEAIAAPAAGVAAVEANARVPRRQHRVLHWGGGALAASIALAALFMARPLTDARAPGLADAGRSGATAPAVVQVAPPAVLADAGVDGVAPANAPVSGDTGGAADLLAAAAPLAVAVPRRATERVSTRSQAQRSAVRRSQTGTDAPVRAVAAAQAPAQVKAPGIASPAAASGSLSAAPGGLPAYAGMGPTASGDVLFGASPAPASRPWPRAVLPGLSRTQPFSAGYGLPAPESFAPFQPRLDEPAIAPVLPRLAPARPAGAAATNDAAAEPRPGDGRSGPSRP